MEKSKEQLEIETLKLKLERERQNRRHLEDHYEQNKFLLQSTQEGIERLVFQVTHDLRAPITVLSQLVEDIIPLLPLERRNVFLSSVARVQDISNEVLKKHNASVADEGIDFTKHTVDVIKQTSSLVQEKRILFEKKGNISIELNLNNLESKPQFANIREMEFNCILSNLLVNSIEAIEEKGLKGLITVEVKRADGFYELKVSDNGIGIKEKVLTEIGNYRVTLKEKGNGLGLYSSIHFLKKRGGSFRIESEYNNWTTVFINIPVAYNQRQKITIQNGGFVVILDDDYLVHETFRIFLSGQKFQGEILNFYSEDEFKTWFKYGDENEIKKALFIVDGFIGSEFPNGPTIITELDISNQAILYSGRSNLISSSNLVSPVFNKWIDLSEIFVVK